VRGRLIYAFLADIHRLDADAMAAVDPDGPGPARSGLDPDFREPVLLDQDADGVAEPWRREHPVVQIPCQVEPGPADALQMASTGNAPRTSVSLVFHFADLERLELVERATGEALLRPGDRLRALRTRDGVLTQSFRSALYAIEVRPLGFGLSLSRPRRNLLLVLFQSRIAARSLL
jgi:hypothetical protein